MSLTSAHGSGPFNLEVGALGEPDDNGLRLPPGFTSRIVARSGEAVSANSDYLWHPAPDGGAVFGTEDGGWIYVSNSEMRGRKGGAGAVRFDANAEIVDAYSILRGTTRNCAGGPTPWGTWLSCEEVDRGLVWECDPLGEVDAVVRPALGAFKHEAVAVDLEHRHVYLTEDEKDGCFYRFHASDMHDNRLDLSGGSLEVAQVLGPPEGSVIWHAIPDSNPSIGQLPLRRQVPEATKFAGGEGIWFHAGLVYFTTKHDNRVWKYDTKNDYLSIFYDDDFFEFAQLTGVDNVTVSQSGDVLVAEDGGDMQIVMISRSRKLAPVVQIVDHNDSEVTGPAFDLSGQRLYFSSQRGARGVHEDGVTYEVTGPF